MMPATEPLQVGVVVVVSVLNVVTVCTLGNASRAVVHDGFALSARSGFNNSPALCPVAGQALASVRGCPRHARHLLILGTYALFLLPEVAGVGALSNTSPRICGTAPGYVPGRCCGEDAARLKLLLVKQVWRALIGFAPTRECTTMGVAVCQAGSCVEIFASR